MKRKVDDYVICPYYKGEEGQCIFREGVEENSTIRLGFSSLTRMKEYKQDQCRRDWNGCQVARMLNRKWGYDAE